MENNIGMFFRALAMITVCKMVLGKWSAKDLAQVIKTPADVRCYWQAFAWLDELIGPYGTIEDLFENAMKEQRDEH